MDRMGLSTGSRHNTSVTGSIVKQLCDCSLLSRWKCLCLGNLQAIWELHVRIRPAAFHTAIKHRTFYSQLLCKAKLPQLMREHIQRVQHLHCIEQHFKSCIVDDGDTSHKLINLNEAFSDWVGSCGLPACGLQE